MHAQDRKCLHYFTVSHVQVFNLHVALHGRYYLHLQMRKLRLREIRLLIPKHTHHKCQKQGCQAPHPVFASHSRLPWAVPLPAAYNVLKIFSFLQLLLPIYISSLQQTHAVHTFTFPVSPALLRPLAQVLASTLACDGQTSPLENLEQQLKPLGLGSGDGQWLSVSSQALAGWTSMDASPGGSWSPQVSMETLLLPILRTRPSASMGTTVLRTPGSLTTGPQRGAPCVGWG